MKKRHIIWLITSLACFFMLGLGVVAAWQNVSQHKTFESETKEIQSSVTLRKYALDENGKKTETLLPGVTFRLFKEDADKDKAPTQIGLDYQTDQHGEIFVDNLTVGNYYFEEVTPPPGYDFLVDKDGKKITQFPFEIKGTEGEHVYLDVYNARLTAELTIEKQVVRPDGQALTDADKDQVFNFIVTFTENGKPVKDSFTYTIGNKELTIKSGEKISLKHGQQAVFKTLPQFIHYEVTEVDHAGYISQGTNTIGDISGTPEKVLFTNLKEIGGLKITKRVLNATSAQDGREYEFTIKFSDDKLYHPYIGDKQVKLTNDGKFYLKADGTAYFSDVPNGVTYTVTETPSKDYVTGTATITGMIVMDRITSHIVTNNFQVLPPGGKGDLEIRKIVSGQGEADDEFTFKVTLPSDQVYTYIITKGDQITTGQIKSGETIKLTAGATATIKDLPLGSSYQVEEINLGAYHPTTTSVSGTISGEDQAVIAEFENIAPPKLTVIKKVAATSVDTDKAFEFKLIISGQVDQVFTLKADESKTFTLPYGASYQIIETDYQKDGYHLTSFENDSREQVTEDITATATNTYYRDDEVDLSGEKTWSVPEGVELPDKITVQLLDESGTVIEEKTVQVNADGKWLYQFKAPKYDANGNEIKYHLREVGVPHFEAEVKGSDIVNTYLAPVNFTPKVEKKITGSQQPTQASEFKFILVSQTDEQKVSILGVGTADFKTLTFDKAGEYVYQIYEETGSVPGYTYDQTPFTLTIKVEKDGQSLKVVSAVYRQADGKVSDWAIFTNTYNGEKPPTPVKPVSIIPKVEKKITGDTPPQASQFNFVLKAADQTPTATQTVSISGAGVANFKSLSFDKAGEYVYYITETLGNVANYTYDRTTTTLTVKVEKDGQNLKVTSVSYRQANGKASDWAIFTNVYKAGGGILPDTDQKPPVTDQKPPGGGMLPNTGDVVTTASVLVGLMALTLVYRKWLKDKRKSTHQNRTSAK